VSLQITSPQRHKQRGLHDIENQLIFRSNPQFIFHDSRGFESGSIHEMETVKTFITKRAEGTELSKQLHAIWYCLPTDTDRPLLEADKLFFNDYGSGKVPVVAIFTKFDGLISTAYGKLRDENRSLREAQKERFERAKEMLNTNFIEPLKKVTFRPSDHVRLDDMRAETSSCNELIEKTADALNEDTLKLLFVSVQENNINLSIRYAVRDALHREHNDKDDTARLRLIVEGTMAWFPHVWKDTEYDVSEKLDHGCSY